MDTRRRRANLSYRRDAGMATIVLLCSHQFTVNQVWDGISDARIDFSAFTLGIRRGGGSNEMARLTETLNLQRALIRHLREQPNVTLLDKTKVENIFEDDIPGGGWPTVQLSDGSALRARLLVCSTAIWDMRDG